MLDTSTRKLRLNCLREAMCCPVYIFLRIESSVFLLTMRIGDMFMDRRTAEDSNVPGAAAGLLLHTRSPADVIFAHCKMVPFRFHHV